MSSNDNSLQLADTGNGASFYVGAYVIAPTITKIPSNHYFSYSSDSTYYGTPDLGWTRSAPGLMEFNNGTVGTLRDVKLRGLWFGSMLTVGTLPVASASSGLVYRVSDSLAPVVGATVSAGGSAKCTVQSDGTNWIVIWIA